MAVSEAFLRYNETMAETMIAVNRKARHEFFLFDRYEAGIELKGCEVKSIREGRIQLQDAYVKLVGGQVHLVNAHISPYRFTHYDVPEPARMRRLLLHRREIAKLSGLMAQKGFACIPLRVYFKHGFAKVEVAMAKKKKMQDKRETLKKRIHRREADRTVKYRAR